ncbi:MAG: ferritin-like domain-containing protein, partial [Ktedonobacteraceae bacterium]|nr:ferritin-like domain-containing protein [Ktedonobacteraceae bacterium]
MTSPFSLTNDQDGVTASDLLQGGSRRSFLRRSALGIAIAAPVGLLAACGGTTTPTTGTTPTANPMLALPSLADSKAPFTDIQAHENAHVAFLKTALGSAARPKPTFMPLLQSDINKFAATSQVLENVGVGAYLFGAGAITAKYLGAAASILTVEARHAGFLDVLIGKPISPN